MPTHVPEFPSLSIRVPFSLISIAIIPTDHHSPTGECHSAEEEGGVTSSLAQPERDARIRIRDGSNTLAFIGFRKGGLEINPLPCT